MATTPADRRVLGTGRRRLEGGDKVTGKAQYTADVQVPGRTFARLVLSPFAHAEVRSIDTSAALAVPGVIAVLTGHDLPEGMAGGGEGALARDWVDYAGQPVALVVGETQGAAADGAAAVYADYEPKPAVPDAASATRPEAPVVIKQPAASDEAATHGAAFGGEGGDDRPRNATSSSKFEKGDVEAAFASAAVVERSYRIASVHQGFLEPHVSMARPDADGGVTVWTSSQGRFDPQSAVADALGLDKDKVRTHPMTIGGGFGGKFALLEALVAVAAQKTGRPVLLALTRSEEFLMGRGAPGCVIDVKLAADADGTLTALRAHVRYDAGAAVGYHAGISSYFLLVPYRVQAYHVTGHDIASHRAPTTAYRAPGATQAFFALECAMDELAAKLGIDPIELRLVNAVQEGDPSPAGTNWGRIALREVLEAARRHPLYTRPAEAGEGVGVAAGGWGGANAPAQAACRVDRDGSLVLTLGTVDVSGTDTTFAMIAGEVLGVDLDRVRIEKPEATQAPPAPGSGGSVTTYSVGPAVQAAAAELRRKLLDLASEHLEAAPEDLEIEDGRFQVRGVPARAVELSELVAAASDDQISARGEAAVAEPAPVFTAQIARVRVDAETGLFELTELAAIQDVGRALNPPEVLGQIHGGTLQSVGRALGEELVYDSEGQLRTGTFADYRLPTIDQAPAFQVELLEENPSALGPFGARHVGEPPAIPGAAALANAVSAATGRRVTSLPIDPQELV